MQNNKDNNKVTVKHKKAYNNREKKHCNIT